MSLVLALLAIALLWLIFGYAASFLTWVIYVVFAVVVIAAGLAAVRWFNNRNR